MHHKSNLNSNQIDFNYNQIVWADIARTRAAAAFFEPTWRPRRSRLPGIAQIWNTDESSSSQAGIKEGPKLQLEIHPRWRI